MKSFFTLRHTNKALLFLVPLLCLFLQKTNAQTNLWGPINKSKSFTDQDKTPDLPALNKGRVYELNLDAMQILANTAPSEIQSLSGTTISLPMPDGSFQQFKVWESSLMEAGLAQKFPEIKSYVIQGIDDIYAAGRMTVSPYGFNAYFVSHQTKQEVFISKVYKNSVEEYISFWGKDNPQLQEEWECIWDDTEHFDASKYIDHGPEKDNETGENALRLFRLAISVPGALSEQQGWTTKAEALAAIVSFLGQINVIYERDLSVRFVLPINQEALVFVDDATDPYTFNGGDGATEESRLLMNDLIGFDNYDLGMVLVTGGCCAAALPSVCRTSKGHNFSRYNNLRVTCHEIGHQFNASHTWTSCGPSNNGQFGINEYGSGTTIMSYTGGCGVDNILPTGETTYFGVISKIQISDYINTQTCYTTLATGNHAPSVTVPADGFHIPISTPFALEAAGTDVDNDPITYSWEQTNIAGVDYDAVTLALSIQTPPVPSDGDVPIQRLFNPTTNPIRIIPQLTDLLSNTSNINERLPTYTRGIKYMVYVRDNHPGGGGTTNEEVIFNVDGTAGPFLVTAPNTCVTWMSGSTQTVTWDVANTTNANVNTQTVNILLSTDGGYTWPHTLAAATANDGTESITVPANLCSNQSRIKVEAEGNIFFDLSNEDFNIEDGSTPIVSSNALMLDGIDDEAIVGNTTLGNFGTGDFTIEFWLKTTSSEYRTLISKRPICSHENFWNMYIDNGNIRVEMDNDAAGAGYTNLLGSTTINDDNWHHVALVRSGSVFTLYVDNSVDLSTNNTVLNFNNTTAIKIGASICNTFVPRFVGEIDEIRIWDVARTSVELGDHDLCLQAGNEANLLAYYPMDAQSCGVCSSGANILDDITANNNDGTMINGAHTVLSTLDVEECPTCTNGNITLTSSPANVSTTSGTMATFTAVATGNNLSYQWELSTNSGTTFSAITGATSASYSFTTTTLQNGHQFRCNIANGCDVQTTTTATLTINCGTLTLSAITGDAVPCQNFYYTYFVDTNADVVTWAWTAPTGWIVTNFDNMIFVQVGSGSGNISLTATDVCGNMDTETFAVAPLLVEITTQPNSQMVSEGASVDFVTAVSTGGGTTTYQWQQSTDNGTTFLDVSGATTATYNIAATTVQHDDRNYRCVISNNCLLDTTNVALLNVNCSTSSPSTPGTIAGSEVVCGSAVLTYSVAEVAGATSYTWTLPVGWTGTSTTNSITTTTNGTGGIITASASNACATSGTANLAVTVNPGTCLNAMHFDGQDDYLAVAQNSQNVDADMTVSFWVKPDKIGGIQDLVYNGHEFKVYLDEAYITYNHSIYGGTYDDRVKMKFSSAPALSANTWYYVAVTRNVANSEVSLYIDGVLAETQTWGAAFPSTPHDNVDYPLSFGAGNGGTVNHYEGILDEIKIWNQLRTATQVAEDMFCVPVGTETGLMAYYGFEQGQPNGVNTAITSFSNAASAYMGAIPYDMALTGTTSNVVDGTKVQSIDGLSNICPGGGSLTYTVDLPGTPTVTWTLPAGWTGSSTTESITVTPGANGGLMIAEATLSCGTARLEKAVSTTQNLTLPANTRALDFDGTDDYIEVPSGSMSLANTSFTIEFWAKRAAAGDRDFFAVQGVSGTNNRLHVGFREGSNSFTIGFWGNDLNTAAAYTDTDWHHWAVIYDKSIADPAHNRFIYRDGVLVASDRSSSDFNGSGAFQVGKYDDHYAAGQLDEFRVWSEARSLADINENKYCSYDCAPAALALYLPMEDGVIAGNNTGLTTIQDYSLYNKTANLTGFAQTGSTSNIVGKLNIPLDGPSAVCADLTWTYTTPTVTGATSYVWTLPSGWTGSSTTNSITVTPNTTSGTVQCVVTNSCGSETFTKAVTANANCHSSMNFDGSNDRIDVTGVDIASKSFTVEFWAKRDNSTASHFIVDQGASTTDTRLHIGFRSTNQLRFAFYSDDMDTPTAYTDTDWHHWACVYDNTVAAPAHNRFIYRDGVVVASGRSIGAYTGSGTMKIGNSFGANHFDGTLDEVRVWDVARTSTQINTDMFCTMQTIPANVLLYLPFEDGTPNGTNTSITSTTDHSATANTATLNNFALTSTASNFVPGVTYTRYRDADADGFGNPAISITDFCSTDAYVLNAADCDDTNMAITPYADEICGNSIDDDCDGNTDTEINKAIHFDATNNNRVSIPTVDHGEFFTVEAWIKVAANTTYRDIINWGGSPNARFIVSNDNRLGYLQNNGGSWGGTNIGDDQWHHVALVHDGYTGNNIKIYVDGNSSVNLAFPNPITATSVTIGASPTGGSEIDGSIDDVRFWNIALTEAQIESRMNRRLDGNETNLVRYYTFDHGIPAMDNTGLIIAKDKTANNADGTLLDFVLTGTTSNRIAGKTYPTFYADVDMDTYGGSTTWTCGTMTGFVENTQDCDDSNAAINPYADEICGNTIDDDCDGNTDTEINKGLHFAAGNSITVPNVSHQEFFTVEAWIKVSATNNFRPIISWGGGTNGNAAFAVSDANLLGYYEAGGIHGGTNIGDDQWHHIALVHDGYGSSNIRTYVDGNSNWTNSFSLQTVTSTLTIGSVEGSLDDVRIWDAALTQAQIQQRMNYRLDGDEANLVRYYTFDHGKPGMDNTGLTIAKDKTANAADGTLNNFTLTGATSNWIAGRSYPTLYADADMDNYGSTSTTWTCGSMTGFLETASDCDDSNPAINPYADEICGNSIDDDCDGNTDIEVNKALNYAAGSNRVALPNLVHSEFFSVEAWVKVPVTGTFRNIVRWNGTTSASFTIYSDGRIGYFEGPGNIGGPNLEDDQWHHVAMTHDGYGSSNVRCYVDGQHVVTMTRNQVIANTSLSLNNIEGSIDDVRFWDVVLTEQQILERMNRRLDGDETNLVRYYPMDHGKPGMANPAMTIVQDKTANAAHGTLENFALTGTTSNWITSFAYPTLYLDNDMDGFGGTTTWTCGSMTNTQDNNLDCDDSTNTINPNALDICGNGIDENCNGVIDDNTLALNFVGDGTTTTTADNKVVLGNGFGNFGTGDFTIEMNMKTSGIDQYLISKTSTASNTGHRFSLSVSASGNLSFLSWEDGFANPVFVNGFTTVINDNNWHHVAIVHSGTLYLLYIDGNLESSVAPSPTNLTANTADWVLGSDPWNGDFTGEMDDVRIWNMARSQADISFFKNAHLTGSESGLLAYYDFNNPTAQGGLDNTGQTILADRTVNNNNGTLSTTFALNGTSSNWVGNPVVTNIWYADTDGDSYGDPNNSSNTCQQPANYVTDNTDCDDTMANVNPGQAEIPANGIDDNCNGQIDEQATLTWVLLDNADTEGSCTSNTDCCTQTFCYGLEYNPANTGTLAAYTTGFFSACVSGASPIVSNASCVMTDNSSDTDGCATESMTLINSSGNNGNLSVTVNVPVIIHQVCFTIPDNSTLMISEDEPTDLTMSVDLAIGGTVTEFPAYSTTTLTGNIPPVVTAGSIDNCYATVALAEAAAITATTATDACTGNVALTASTTGTCSAVITVTGTDDCGLTATVTYNTRIDNAGPTITGTLTAVTIEGCGIGDVTAAVTTVAALEALAGGVTIADNCTSDVNLTVTSSDASTGTCPLVVTRTYTITDECGEASTLTHTINIDDTTAPTITGTLTAATIEGCGIGDVTVAVTTVAELEALAGGVTIADNCTSDANFVVTSSDASTGTCPLVITRTYTITDECGEASTLTHTINIDDTTAPTVTGTLTAATIEGCGIGDVTAAVTTVAELEALAGGVTISDNCTSDANLVVTSSNASTGTCPVVVTRTYTITDECGEASTLTHTINIDDTTAPAITGTLTAATIEGCGIGDVTAAVTTVAELEALAGGVTIADNCTSDANLVVTSSDASTGTCPVVVTRTYTITDECGEASTLTHTINIDDTTAPTVTGTLTAATIEGCGIGDVTAAVTTVTELEALAGGVTIADNCTSDANLVVTSSDASTGTCPVVVTRTYTITDECGEASTLTHTINIDDTTAPTITGTLTAATIEGCGIGDVTAAVTTVVELEALAGGVTIADNCTSDVNLTVTSSDTSTGTCPVVVTRTYTITDECGEASTLTHTINIDDTTAPTITGTLTAATIEGCGIGDVTVAVTTVAELEALAGGVTIADNCTSDANLVVTSSDANTGTCPVVVTRTYTITDECGEASTLTHTINIDDTTAPTITGTLTAATIEGCGIGDVTAAVTTVAELEALAGGVTIADNCTSDANLVVTSSDASTGTCPVVITRTYTITDECGEASTLTHTINIDDTTAPTITGTLTAATIEGCGIGDVTAAVTTVVELEALAGGVTIADNCTSDANLVVTSSDASTGTCPVVVTRTYTITDECGEASTLTHTINIDDTTAPTITGTLTAATIEGCGIGDVTVAVTTVAELEALAGGVTIADNCTSDANLTVGSSDTSTGTCPVVVTRTYTITDECGEASTLTHTINIDDTTNPVLTQGTIASCYETQAAAESAALTATSGTDNCGGTVSFSVATTGSCPSTITVTGSDVCGNMASVNYTTIITNGTAPMEIGGPVASSITIQNALDAAEPNVLPVIQDVCGNVLTPSVAVIGGNYTQDNCEGTITYTYTYTDCASTTFDWIYTYNIDCEKLNIKVYIEGPYIVAEDTMSTQLNIDHLLPGQDKTLSPSLSVRLTSPFTPFGQPYSAQPWNYSGITGANIGDASSPSAPAIITPYSQHVVDWVLVTVREDGILPVNDIFTCAGWLYKDGSVSFPENCMASLVLDELKTYSVVIQHRNHLGILGTATLQGGDDHLKIDFTVANSYRPNVFRVGQKEVNSGVWAMLCANGDQINSILSINSVDRTIWKLIQNQLGYYNGDYNMNVISNSADETKWKNNQNKTTGVTFE